MSLTKPHQVCLTAGPNPYEEGKAVVKAQILSGIYRSELLCRHWSSNVKGICLAGTCTSQVESIEHILISCPAYSTVRDKLKQLWLKPTNPIIRDIVSKDLCDPP